LVESDRQSAQGARSETHLRLHLLIPHGLGRLVDVHHHGALEVGDGAGYRVYAVIVGERPAVFGDVGELVEEGVVPILGSCVLAKEAMAALDVIAPASSSWILPPISFARHVTAVAKFLLIAIERKLRPANCGGSGFLDSGIS
jgi:hypothetical protein